MKGIRVSAWFYLIYDCYLLNHIWRFLYLAAYSIRHLRMWKRLLSCISLSYSIDFLAFGQILVVHFKVCTFNFVHYQIHLGKTWHVVALHACGFDFGKRLFFLVMLRNNLWSLYNSFYRFLLFEWLYRFLFILFERWIIALLFLHFDAWFTIRLLYYAWLIDWSVFIRLGSFLFDYF